MFDDIKRTIDKIAAKYKIDDYELLLTTGNNTSFNIEQHDLTLSSEVEVSSLAMRLIKNGKLTYASSTVFDEAALDRIIQASLTNLQPTDLVRFAVIPAGLKQDFVDKKLADLLSKPKELRDLLASMAAETFKVGKGKFERLNGGGGVSIGESWVYTAGSPEPAYSRQSAFSVSASLDSRDFEYIVSKKMPRDSAILGLGVKVAKRLPAKNLKPSDLGVKGKSIDVILHPNCFSGLFNQLIAEHIYATNKLSGLSRFKLDEKLASPKLTIYDDATHPELLSSAPTDNEGVVSQKVELFKKGVFKSFLYDAETALVDRHNPTGNGMRRPVLAEDTNEAPIRPSLRSLLMEPGKIKLKDMIKGIKKGVLLKFLLGLHTADKVSGSFANTALMSYVIENGKLVATAEPGTWAMQGNALQMLKNISAVSSERLNMGSALLPWLKTRLQVS